MVNVILETNGLTRYFGALAAVYEMDLALRKNEIRSIIGPNGAGKTTLFHLITGYLRPDKGGIKFNGEYITGNTPNLINKKGIARTFQITNIFRGLTCYENVRIACQSKIKGLKIFYPTSRLKNVDEETTEILKAINLYERKDMLAGELSHGEQRHLEIGISLSTKPQLLILDEPTSGMTEIETEQTMDLIKKIAKNEVTIMLVEHDMRVVMGISDVITVMHLGKKIAEGKPEEIKENKEVKRIYLGGEV